MHGDIPYPKNASLFLTPRPILPAHQKGELPACTFMYLKNKQPKGSLMRIYLNLVKLSGHEDVADGGVKSRCLLLMNMSNITTNSDLELEEASF